MKFLVDNNLPPPFARALHALSENEGHQVLSLKEKFAANTSDVDWIGALQAEGDWVVISQDHFRKGNLEKKAFRECGLPIFCLARQWSAEQYWSKAHNLVRWWPAIIRQAEQISGGAAFRVPWRFTKPGKFEQIKI